MSFTPDVLSLLCLLYAAALLKSRSSAFTFAALLAGMNACTSVGKLTEARQLLQDMRQQNIPVDIRVFNILLKGYSRRGGVSAVSGILQELAEAGLKPSAVTYNTLIDTYGRAGQLAEAKQTCADAQAAGVPQTLGPLVTPLLPAGVLLVASCACT